MTTDAEPERPDADSPAVPVAELHALKRRGFGTVTEAELARSAPALSALARRCFDVAPASPPPLRKLFHSAIARIADESLRGPAAALFGVSRETYGKSFAYRQDIAAAMFDPAPARSTFRQRPQYTPRIVAELAAALATVKSTVVVDETRVRRITEQIDRPEQSREAERLLAEARLLWIWGEAGTGKTVLAEQVADRVRGPLPAVKIRLGNSRVTEADVLAALDHDDVDARTWSPAACRHQLRRMIQDGGALGIVIIDGADKADDAWELVPPAPRVPVIVTGRTLPARLDGASAPASLQLGVYTPEQSATAIGRLLPALSAGERERLAEAIGHHPLVLDRMCRHVLADPEWSLDAMIAALSVDTPGALDAVDSISGAAERLSRIHQRTLEALQAWDPNAVRVLETLVWTADRGEVPKDLADEFLRHRFPGPVGSLSIAAAEITLSRWALVTVEANAFVMHPLTAAVFQRLLADSCQPVLTEFFDFLRGVPLTSEIRLVNLLRGELAVFDGAFPDSWNRVGSWFVLSNSVWLKQWRTGTSDAERYEVFPDSVQATTGPRRHHVTGSELSELLAVTTDYFRAMERLYTTSDALPDAEITEPDGFAHYVRKDAPAVDGVTQARCGKRWRRSPGAAVETLPICPLCERNWEARVADVVAKPPPALGYLRRKAEVALRADDADAAAAAVERLREAPFARPFGANRTAVRQLSEAAFELLRTPAEEDFVSSAERLRLLGVAETWYRKLAEILPADADIPWKLGQVIVAQEECEESVDAERSRDRYSEAVRHYRRSLELEPDDVDMLLRIDDALYQAAGRVGREESERLYRESEYRLRVSPAAGRGDPKMLARIAFALEMRGCYFLETDPAFAEVLLAEAVEWAEASLRAQPDNPTTLDFLGRALQRRGRATRVLGRPGARDLFRRAEESFRRSIELAPGIPDPMHDLAETLQLLVDPSAAPEVESAAWAAAGGAYAAGLAACPDDPAWLRAWLDGLGWCTYQQARLLEGRDAEGALVLYGKAIDHLTRSLAVERLPHILRNLGTVQVNMAQLMERTGQADAARAFEATTETLRPVLGGGGGADLSVLKQLSYALVHQANLMRSAEPAACDSLYAEASGLLAPVEERHVWALKLAAEASVGRALIAIDSAPDLAAGYFAEATAPLRRALDLDPDNAHTRRYLAAVLSKRAELVEATDPELAGHLRAQEADLRERSRMPSEDGRR